MCYSNIYCNIIVYQKHLVTSINVRYATRRLYVRSGPKRLKEFRLTIRGDWDQTWSLENSRYIVPAALLVSVQRLRNDMYKAVEGPSTRPVVLSMIAWLC